MGRKQPEKQLERWLKKNLQVFNPSLKMIGTQVQTNWKIEDRRFLMRVDLLAQHQETKVLYVIEVKVSAKHWAASIQLPFYLNKYREFYNLNPVGVIAAQTFSHECLKIAKEKNYLIWDISKHLKSVTEDSCLRAG